MKVEIPRNRKKTESAYSNRKTLLRGNKLYMTPKLRKTVMKRFKSKSYSNNSGSIADQSAYKKLIKEDKSSF